MTYQKRAEGLSKYCAEPPGGTQLQAGHSADCRWKLLLKKTQQPKLQKFIKSMEAYKNLKQAKSNL